jgi:hypothetical protein
MFVDGYDTYENFIDAATRSLQAVEAALRVRLEAESKISFAQLIDQAKKTASSRTPPMTSSTPGASSEISKSTGSRPPSSTRQLPPGLSGPHTRW